MMATATMVPLLAVMLLTPGVSAENGLPPGVDLRTVPGPPYVGRSGADLLLNSSQPAGAVLLNGRDIVSGLTSSGSCRVLHACPRFAMCTCCSLNAFRLPKSPAVKATSRRVCAHASSEGPG